jgi:serine-type D-Ala-D-Ala carboxypeptidase/endopeptidase (penicillin-binding protein 4)
MISTQPFLKIGSKLLLLSLICCFFSKSIKANELNQLEQNIFQLIQNGSVLLHNEKGQAILSYQPDKPLVPASIVKILSSQIAIAKLGKDYRFKTEFYLDHQKNLLIKGYGDPFLISEEIKTIVKNLFQKGLTKINQIYLDHSSFESDIIIPGTSNSNNPYDALVGALVVNFNTINVQRLGNGEIKSAEKETPLTPLAASKGKTIKTGTTERISLTQNYQESLQYVGELFQVLFQKQNIVISKKDIAIATISDSWKLLYRHFNSHNLDFILTGLLKYSNNYIANQIFLIAGGEKFGFPANLTKAKSVFQGYVQKNYQFDENIFLFKEASGLSRDNLMTAKMMMQVLEKFKKYQYLLTEKKGVLVKSGTLTGIYNYAGYIKTEDGLFPYTILLSQKKNNRDKILTLMRQYVKLTKF